MPGEARGGKIGVRPQESARASLHAQITLRSVPVLLSFAPQPQGWQDHSFIRNCGYTGQKDKERRLGRRWRLGSWRRRVSHSVLQVLLADVTAFHAHQASRPAVGSGVRSGLLNEMLRTREVRRTSEDQVR